MKHWTGWIIALLAGMVSFQCERKPVTETRKTVLTEFQNPSAEMRTAPLWVWNDRVDTVKINEQLIDFREHGIGGVFIHPRPGLITPYLSQEWLDLCAYTVNKGKALGMKVWIYDENSYPSGFAGGHVPAEMPDARVKGLQHLQVKRLNQAMKQKPLVVLRKTADGLQDITAELGRQSFGQGEYHLFQLKENEPSPWFGGFDYVDVMRKEVTEKFITTTMAAYQSSFGAEFGKTVPGVFQDEAHIVTAYDTNCVTYTPHLFEAFTTKWGYDLRPNLVSLYATVGDWRRVRHNYYSLLQDLFIQGWAIPYADYCSRHQLTFTGHYWEHEWPHIKHGPDPMALSSYSHMPGIDILMNRWATDPHAQFGNHRAVKEIRSVANQFGYKRTLSETYGAAGWDLSFFDQKRIADWEYSLGVNFINQHLSYMTIMGARKRDHPQSFSYHEPWWPAYKTLADYCGRLSVVMSSGRQENKILVLEPTTTAWLYYQRTQQPKILDSLGVSFQNLVNQLEAWQVEYDLGSEEVLRRIARVEKGKLVVGPCQYELIILPALMENVDSSTADLLQAYSEAKGKVLAWSTPEYIDGQKNDRLTTCARKHSDSWIPHQKSAGVEEIFALQPPVLSFEDVKNGEMLFHHRRELDDAEMIFLVNSSDSVTCTGSLSLAKQKIEVWDPFTGSNQPYPVQAMAGRGKVTFSLPPAGSLLLCARSGSSLKIKTQPQRQSVIAPVDPLQIQAEDLNVLTMDYCDLYVKGKMDKELYFYDAQLKTFKAYGLEQNPWDSAVQFKTNILDKDKFGPNSGFEAVYWFTTAPGVDLASLELVVERPQLVQVRINDQLMEPAKGRWWLDKAFGVYPIGETTVTGKNKISLTASQFTIHTELEAIYLRGHFSLKVEDKGFTLIPEHSLQLGAWKDQGAPFYSYGVTYSHTYDLSSDKQARYIIQLGRWSGTFSQVMVNGQNAGIIAFQPAELDLSRFLIPGANTVQVIVFGSLKNLLGPHHNNPGQGSAWPGMFQKGWSKGYPSGAEYSTLAYGLFEDFSLVTLY